MMYKDYVKLFIQSIKDRKLTAGAKIVLGLGIAYIISPIDIIPDVGLPLGIVDDTVLAAVLLGVGGKLIYNKIKTDPSAKTNEENVVDI